jgi:hypothetical protein
MYNAPQEGPNTSAKPHDDARCLAACQAQYQPGRREDPRPDLLVDDQGSHIDNPKVSSLQISSL